MKITPIEIRQKSFEKAFRGYEKEEVDAFLKSLSREWEKLNEDNKELKRRLESSEKEVQRLRDVESSLFKTLKTAEDTGANVIEQANKSAELHLKEAQIKAEAVLNEAKSRARNLIEEAEERARGILSEMQDDVKTISKDYNYIEDQKDNLLQTLQSYANETLERVERMRGKSNKKDVDRKIREIKSLVFESRSSESDFLNTETPKIELKEIPKPQPVKPLYKPEEDNQEDKKDDKGGQNSFFDSI